MATIEQSTTFVVELAKLADAALLARKLRKRGTGHMFENAIITATGSLCGGNYRDFVSVPLSSSVTFPESFAIPYELIAAAATRARKQLVTVGHGFLHREDGQRFEWEPNEKARRYFDEMLEESLTLCDDHTKLGFSIEDFTACVEAAHRAVPKNDARPRLFGVAIVSAVSAYKMPEADYDHVAYDFVATDAFRMHAARTTGTLGFYRQSDVGMTDPHDGSTCLNLTGNVEVVIPVEPLRLASLVKGAQTVFIIVNGERVTIIVQTGDAQYAQIRTSIYPDSGYPNYEAVFENATDRNRIGAEVAVDTNRMLDALAAVCADASRNDRRGKPVRIRLYRDELTLEAPGDDDSNDPYVVRPLPDTHYGDHATPDTMIELGVNGQYLYDAVRSMGSDTTIIRFTCRDGKYETPICVTGTEAYNAVDGYGERCIVMPMRA